MKTLHPPPSTGPAGGSPPPLRVLFLSFMVLGCYKNNLVDCRTRVFNSDFGEGGNGAPHMGGDSRGGSKSGRGGMARDADATI